MAYDLLKGMTSGDWARSTTMGASLPAGATGYAPESWISATEAETKVRSFQKSGGLFGTSLPREAAERKTLEYLRAQKIGIMSGTIGSWLLPEKQQQAILNKIDDVRYDLRAVGRHVGLGAGLLAASLGLMGIASIYRTSTMQKEQT
jgi:hypothetical protein